VEIMNTVDALLGSIGQDWSAERAETANIDFKETPETAGDTGPKAAKRFHEMLAETAVCFANADGGAIVVGVRDRASTREQAIPGIPARRTADQLVQAIYERTAPPITVRPVVRQPSGKTVIVLGRVSWISEAGSCS
jgi:ATP-dependent DNA helicase RecG